MERSFNCFTALLFLDNLACSLPSVEQQAQKQAEALDRLVEYVRRCGGTLPEGWSCTMRFRVTTRRNGRVGRTTDNYYHSPCGCIFRNYQQVAEYLKLGPPQPLEQQQQQHLLNVQLLPTTSAKGYYSPTAASTTSSSSQGSKRAHCAVPPVMEHVLCDSSNTAAKVPRHSKQDTSCSEVSSTMQSLTLPGATALEPAVETPISSGTLLVLEAATAASRVVSSGVTLQAPASRGMQPCSPTVVASHHPEAVAAATVQQAQAVRHTKAMLAAKYAISTAAAPCSSTNSTMATVTLQCADSPSKPSSQLPLDQRNSVAPAQHVGSGSNSFVRVPGVPSSDKEKPMQPPANKQPHIKQQLQWRSKLRELASQFAADHVTHKSNCSSHSSSVSSISCVGGTLD